MPGFETKPKSRFPVKRIVAIAIGTLIGIPLMLIWFIRIQSTLFTRASDVAPRDVVISEIKEQEAVVHWYTDQESQGTILYGTSPGELRLLVPEQGAAQDHTLTIPLLQPGTDYYFVIKIGTDVYDNGGTPWTFTTKTPGEQPTATPPAGAGCPKTDDCDQIQDLLGSACTVTDYVQCLKRNPKKQ